MLRRPALLASLLAGLGLGAFALAQDAPPAPTGETEPPLLLYAEHAGAEVPVALDAPVTVGGATFTLRARAHRALETRAFQVHYPRTYHFEYELDGLHMWTLTGADASLMVFLTNEALDAREFLDNHVSSMAEQFEGAAVETTALSLEGTEQKGKRLRMTVGTTTLTQEAFALALPDGRALLLVVQDSPGERRSSAEADALRALVSKTFRRRT